MASTAIVPKDASDRQSWLTLVSSTIAKDAKLSVSELSLFAQVCDAAGLDPFRREIYAIRYKEGGPLSIVIGVDGYLRKVGETGLYDGMDSILYSGIDEVWRELWVSEKPPYAAKASVYRKGTSRPITYIARYDSAFRQFNVNWKSMPDVMLGINALRQALRRGFPEAFGNLDKSLEALRSEGLTVDQETGEIIDGSGREITQAVGRLEPTAEQGAASLGLEQREEKAGSPPTVAPPQPRKETPISVGDLSTRFWTIAKARGTAFYEPILKQFGTTDFALLDPDEQEKVVALMEDWVAK